VYHFVFYFVGKRPTSASRPGTRASYALSVYFFSPYHFFYFFYFSQHTTHTAKAERRAEVFFFFFFFILHILQLTPQKLSAGRENRSDAEDACACFFPSSSIIIIMLFFSLLEENVRGLRPGRTHARAVLCQESRRRARDSRAPPVEGGADGCDARALSAQPTAMKSLQIHELPLR